jgi:phosphomannomutase
MSDAPLILGVSGLRGIVGESLTPEVAVRYAASFGRWLRSQTPSHRATEVLIASDGRAGGNALLHAVSSGLLSVGCNVRSIAVATTPTVGVVLDAIEYDGALILTASHNPQEWNGIKALVRSASWENAGSSDGRGRPAQDGVDACAPSAVMADALIDQYQNQETQYNDNWNIGRYCWDDDANDKHCFAVKHAVERVYGMRWNDRVDIKRGLRVVTDSVNASSCEIDHVFFRGGPVELIQLNARGTGWFPHTPEPTRENLSGEGGLCDVVPGVKADVGFAQDPDADRLAIVDEKGEYIGEEYTLVLCAMALMEARGGQGGSGDGKPVFVVNLSTSRMIDDVAKHYGGEVVRTAVGEANVVEAMKSLKASGRDVVLGGEGNGGVIWSEVTYVRDSLSGMALVLSLMARTGKTVSQLVEMINGLGPTDEVKASGYTIIKKKSALAKKSDADPVVEHLRGIYDAEGDCRVDLQDGIRIDWDAKGVWAHVRASNTEPIMRVIVEAPSGAEAEDVAAQIDAQIASMGS